MNFNILTLQRDVGASDVGAYFGRFMEYPDVNDLIIIDQSNF